MYDLAVQNDKLILRNLIPEDKEDYYKLYQDTSIIKKKTANLAVSYMIVHFSAFYKWKTKNEGIFPFQKD